MTTTTDWKLGKYEILSEIGRGGFSTVYKARDKVRDRIVALKILDPYFVGQSDFVAQFQEEANKATQLQHPNIVRMYEVGSVDNRWYVAMEYVEGQSLARLLEGQGPLQVQRAWQIVQDVAAALDAAHRQKIIHCDVKPSNILIRSDGRAMLTDFGLARATDTSVSASLTASARMAGTPRYMAPEQVEGRRLDLRTDLYSLGIVFYEMITGQSPFQAETPAQFLRAHADKEPRRPSKINRQITHAVESVILRALAKEPKKRHPSARIMARALEKAIVDNIPEDKERGSGRLYGCVAGVLVLGIVVVSAALLYITLKGDYEFPFRTSFLTKTLTPAVETLPPVPPRDVLSTDAVPWTATAVVVAPATATSTNMPTLTPTPTPSTTQTPTLTSTPTPTTSPSQTPTANPSETPSQTPAPVQTVGDFLFADDFETGARQEWDFETGGNLAFVNGHLVTDAYLQGMIHVGDETWRGYRIEFDHQFDALYVRVQDEENCMIVDHHSGYSYYWSKEIDGRTIKIPGSDFTAQYDDEIQIEVKDNLYRVLVNEEEVLRFYDDELGYGGVGFLAYPNLELDGFKVFSLPDSGVAAPTLAPPTVTPATLLFADDFETGARQEWDFETGGNLAFVNGHLVTDAYLQGMIHVGDETWRGYRIEFDHQFDALYVRVQDEENCMIVDHHSGYSYYWSKEIDGRTIKIPGSDFTAQYDDEIQIEVKDNLYRVLVNEDEVLRFYDHDLGYGGVGFLAYPNLELDGFEVHQLP